MFEQVAINLPQNICDIFRKALITGCWENGTPLTMFHRRTCEEALLYKEAIGSAICH
ncbi:MAG: DUF1315 domain-containing protein [Gammaproteobacteria bacterium]|nr:DUF1315 domain-containing protein [Gammaproteobacteria bacterium]